jgi:hypothetical protein
MTELSGAIFGLIVTGGTLWLIDTYVPVWWRVAFVLGAIGFLFVAFILARIRDFIANVTANDYAARTWAQYETERGWWVNARSQEPGDGTGESKVWLPAED